MSELCFQDKNLCLTIFYLSEARSNQIREFFAAHFILASAVMAASPPKKQRLTADRDLILKLVKKIELDVIPPKIAIRDIFEKYVPDDLRADREFVLELANTNGVVLLCVADKLRADRDVVRVAVSETYWGHFAFEYAAMELRSDRDFVLDLVKQTGYALEYASEDLRADREIVLAAAIRDEQALLYSTDERFCADRDFILELVKQNGEALEYAAEELRADREIVLAAVGQAGWALNYAADDLRADREVVLAAVSQSGWTLKYAADELRADREIFLAAVSGDGNAFEFGADKFRADREIVLATIQREQGFVLRYASAELRADREVVLASLHNGGHLEHAAKELHSDREIVLAAVRKFGWDIQYASEYLQTDIEIGFEAIRTILRGETFSKFVTNDEFLDSNPMLVEAAQNNKIASRGTAATICTVVEKVEGGYYDYYTVLIGMGGKSVIVSLPNTKTTTTANVGDLACEISRAAAGGMPIHLIINTGLSDIADEPIPPWSALEPLTKIGL